MYIIETQHYSRESLEESITCDTESSNSFFKRQKYIKFFFHMFLLPSNCLDISQFIRKTWRIQSCLRRKGRPSTVSSLSCFVCLQSDLRRSEAQRVENRVAYKKNVYDCFFQERQKIFLVGRNCYCISLSSCFVCVQW